MGFAFGFLFPDWSSTRRYIHFFLLVSKGQCLSLLSLQARPSLPWSLLWGCTTSSFLFSSAFAADLSHAESWGPPQPRTELRPRHCPGPDFLQSLSFTALVSPSVLLALSKVQPQPPYGDPGVLSSLSKRPSALPRGTHCQPRPTVPLRGQTAPHGICLWFLKTLLLVGLGQKEFWVRGARETAGPTQLNPSVSYRMSWGLL